MTDQIDTILDSELEQIGATAPIATVSDFLTLSRERLRPPREHGSCERLLSISASFGLRTFRESLIQQPADRANQV
ncbi:MAG TPA: hypothetical protein VN476_17145 [Pyrinomonadaceae bacterium]|nr:hypothetical protein [Pyrinomonadaceae bacterium]